MNKSQLFTSALAVVGLATVGITTARAQAGSEASSDNAPIYTENGAQSKTTTQRVNASGARKLRLNMEYGEVIIKTSNTREAVATLTKKIKQVKKGNGDMWLENNWLKARVQGDTIIIEEDKGLKPKVDGNLEATLTLEVPNDLETDLDLDAGELNVSGSSSSMEVSLDAGEVNLNKVDCDSSMEVKLGAGEVNANLVAVPSRGCKLSTDVGEISFNAGGGASVDASVTLGRIEARGQRSSSEDSLGDKMQITLGNGGPKVILRVETGAINVGGGAKVKKSSDDKSFSFNHDLNSDDKWNGDDFPFKGKFRGEDFDFDGEQLGKDIEKSIREAMKEVEKELSNADLEMSKAMKEFKFDEKEMNMEMEQSMREAMKEVEKELQKASKELEKAFKDMKFKGDMKGLSEKDMEKLMKDIKVNVDSKQINSKEISAIVRAAMAHARQSVEKSLKEAQRAIQKVRTSDLGRKETA